MVRSAINIIIQGRTRQLVNISDVLSAHDLVYRLPRAVLCYNHISDFNIFDVRITIFS